MSQARGMTVIRSRVSIVAVALLLSTLAIPISSSSGCGSSSNRLLDQISGIEIMSTVVDLQSFGTREFHTSSAEESALYIEEQMDSLGLEAHMQEFDVDGVAVANVAAVLNPDLEADQVFLIGAHYDSENSQVVNQSEAENITAPGADDNGSGIGVMLEIARVLSLASRFPAAIKFVAFGAEEMGYDSSGGMKGSTEFAKAETEAGVTFDGVFVIDMVGYRVTAENRATLVCNEASAPLAQTMTEAATDFDIDISLLTVQDERVTYSDHASFWEAGYPSILMVEELYPTTYIPVNPYYHSSADTAEKLSEEQMTEVARTVLATILYLTDQGEDSYTLAYYGIAAATFVAAVTVVTLLLLNRRKGEA